ncbi:MAG: preprotein translocase subunit SecG [Treponema sp.]|jgi:preprotein translocase subunit SecG|nr:preprotein translocase subunit SecG [Treponema sp.]
MNALSVVLLVFFVIIAILLILLVLVQNEEGDSMGGIFAGGGGSAFGSRAGNVLTKTTTVLGTLFLALSLALALLSRGPAASSGVEAEGFKLSPETTGSWLDEELNPRTGPVETVEPAGAGLETVEPAETGEPAAEAEASGVLE